MERDDELEETEEDEEDDESDKSHESEASKMVSRLLSHKDLRMDVKE